MTTYRLVRKFHIARHHLPFEFKPSNKTNMRGDFENFSVCFIVSLLVVLVHGSEFDLHKDCVMRLGQHGQGFDIQCEGGADQISLFNRYLRQQVLLPTLIKMALKTDLCSISQQLVKYGKIFGFKKVRQQRSNPVVNQHPSWLDQLSDEQLESLLEELNETLKDDEITLHNITDESGITFQSQSQIQEIHTEIHTHKHVYVYYSDSGQLVALPPFADSLDNSSLAQLVDMIEAQPSTTPVSTSSSDDPTVPINTGGGGGNGVYTCGETSNGYTTNFVNPSYPNYSTTSELDNEVCTFMLVISDSKVCQVRVDFVDTQLLQPINGECSQQYLTLNGPIWPLGVQKFCGKNDGQHFYIELDQQQNTSEKKVEFSVVSTPEVNNAFKWGLWITQIKCDGSTALESPKGCFQYFLQPKGYLTSFAFESNGQYLNDQAYRICIMASKGACRIAFTAEDFGLEKFGNYKTSPFSRSGVSSKYCARDFVRIPEASASGFLHTSSHDRYCGGKFNAMHNVNAHGQVIAPILSRLVSIDVRAGNPNLYPSKNFAGAKLDPPFNPTHHQPGFKIAYEQLTDHTCPYVDLSYVGQ